MARGQKLTWLLPAISRIYRSLMLHIPSSFPHMHSMQHPPDGQDFQSHVQGSVVPETHSLKQKKILAKIIFLLRIMPL